MSIYDAARKLSFLYNNKTVREHFAKNSLEKAKQYEWDNVMPLWIKALEKFK